MSVLSSSSSLFRWPLLLAILNLYLFLSLSPFSLKFPRRTLRTVFSYAEPRVATEFCSRVRANFGYHIKEARRFPIDVVRAYRKFELLIIVRVTENITKKIRCLLLLVVLRSSYPIRVHSPLFLFLFLIFHHFFAPFCVSGYVFSDKTCKLRKCINSYFLFTSPKLHWRFYVRGRSRSRAPLPRPEVPRTPARFRATAITGKIPVVRRETIEITMEKLL